MRHRLVDVVEVEDGGLELVEPQQSGANQRGQPTFIISGPL